MYKRYVETNSEHAMKTLIPTALVLLLASACSSNLKQVPVEADQNTRVGLSGVWAGVLQGENADKGQISFQLQTGHHTATGGVKMYDKNGVKMVPMDSVQVKNGNFVGKTKAFRSADCDCLVTTEFRGLVKGDVIDGTFTSVDDKGNERQGSWALYREQKQ